MPGRLGAAAGPEGLAGGGIGGPRCGGGGSPERQGHVARSAGSLPTSKCPIIPGRLASTGRAASPRPSSAVPPLPATLVRANCSDISALTGPGARTSRNFSQSRGRWAAFPGLSPGGVWQEEAGGRRAAHVGSAPDPRGDGGTQAPVPADSDHRPRQRDSRGPSSPGRVRAVSACVTQLHAFPRAHATRVHKDNPGHTLEVTFSPRMAGDSLLTALQKAPVLFYGGGPAEPQDGDPQSCGPLERVWGGEEGLGSHGADACAWGGGPRPHAGRQAGSGPGC